MANKNKITYPHLHPLLSIKGVPFFILMAYLFLYAQPNLGIAVPEIIGATGLIIVLMGMGAMSGDRSGSSWSPMTIMGFAAVFRLLFLWRAPELSDDIFRYVFDGMMTINGHNPYAAAPANVLPSSPQMHDLIALINHSHLITIYPPAAQLVFALGGFTGGVVGMKLVLVLFDLATCAVIIGLLSRLNLPANRAVLYAWHPLPVIEIGASGHIDAAAVFFLVSGFLMIVSSGLTHGADAPPKTKRLRFFYPPVAAGVMATFSIFTKWMPMIFLPGFWMMTPQHQRRQLFSGILIAAVALPLIFLPDVTNSLNTLTTYLQNWEFSGFLFRSFRDLTGSGESARLICAGLFVLVSGMVYVQMFLKNHPASILNGTYTIAFAFLVLTPTLHPWYALYLAALLPFAGGPAGLVFSWSVFLSYRVMMVYILTGQWTENGGIPLLIVSAPAAAVAAGVLLKFLKGKAKSFRFKARKD